MTVNPVAQSAASRASSAGSSSGQGLSDMYMQLLMAQLKNQSPLNPVDPNQFAGQLAQFNTLNEVIQIRELLQSFSAASDSSSDFSKGASNA
jgi:flagellar basal-body rod modification protein FlgD